MKVKIKNEAILQDIRQKLQVEDMKTNQFCETFIKYYISAQRHPMALWHPYLEP